MPDTSSYMDRWNNVSGEILRDPKTDSIVAAERALDDEYTPNQEILEVFGASEMIEMRNDVILSSIPLTRRDIAHIYDVL